MFWHFFLRTLGIGKFLISMIFFIMSIFQFFPIFDALKIYLGFHWIIASLLALIIAGMPIIGSILGMFGAIQVWEWSWIFAFLLFWGPFITIFGIVGIIAFLEKIKPMQRISEKIYEKTAKRYN